MTTSPPPSPPAPPGALTVQLTALEAAFLANREDRRRRSRREDRAARRRWVAASERLQAWHEARAAELGRILARVTTEAARDEAGGVEAPAGRDRD